MTSFGGESEEGLLGTLKICKIRNPTASPAPAHLCITRDLDSQRLYCYFCLEALRKRRWPERVHRRNRLIVPAIKIGSLVRTEPQKGKKPPDAVSSAFTRNIPVRLVSASTQGELDKEFQKDNTNFMEGRFT